MSKRKSKNVGGKRQYKDTVFIDLFAKDITAKENFISLYNALHDSNIDAATAKVTPVILQNVLYHGYFNDVSMMIDDKIVVFAEHQSTVNENMPLRFLGYVCRVYENLMDAKKRFSRKMQQLPTPEFYVFYNGKEPYPTEKILKLSDAFMRSKNQNEENSEENGKNSDPSLEILVKVININVEKGSDILKKCKPLGEYSKFVGIVRDVLESDDIKTFDYAVQQAIDEGVLKEYLSRKRKEVENMVVGMYDYDLDMEVQREEAREEGSYNARIETARGMLAYGMSQEKVSEISRLPISEVRTLATM